MCKEIQATESDSWRKHNFHVSMVSSQSFSGVNYFSLAWKNGFHSKKAHFQSWENRSFRSTNSYYTKFGRGLLICVLFRFCFNLFRCFLLRFHVFHCVLLCFVAVFFFSLCCILLHCLILEFVVLSFFFAFSAYFFTCIVFCFGYFCCSWRGHSSEVSETFLPIVNRPNRVFSHQTILWCVVSL